VPTLKNPREVAGLGDHDEPVDVGAVLLFQQGEPGHEVADLGQARFYAGQFPP
jgi:hypothetical protein